MESVVYFVQAVVGGPIKIGRCADITKRIAALQTGCPFRLQLLCSVPGGRDEERALQKKFAALHAGLEWFRPEEPLLGFIAAHGGRASEARPWSPGAFADVAA